MADVILNLPREELVVVLLGPGADNFSFYEKRRQILARLHEKGYRNAKLGEEVLGEDNPLPLHIALINMVSATDLILVLDAGPAPLTELTALSVGHSNYEARQITKVWCFREYIGERRSTPADVVSMFDYHLFGNDEFEQCDLVAEFVDAAERICFNRAQKAGLLSDIGLAAPDL